ncbi:MAG TPA: alkaline phosphatase family protein, partial [Candidatus Eremiobacteraceae bacterium]|nr:alkaline phosphatase family protein [Candidatus Eremiobacteraceae bacterium]
MVLVATLGIAACAGNGSTNIPGTNAQHTAHEASSTSQYIKHVIIIVQENRSFDDFFSDYPGANGTTYG